MRTTRSLPGQSIAGLQPLDTLKDDAISYDSVATNLLNGEGYVNSAGEVPILPPVYPTFLAGVYEMSAHSFTAGMAATTCWKSTIENAMPVVFS